MARFDVHKNKAASFPPLLLLAQSELHDHLPSRVAIPLVPSDTARGRKPDKLMPEFTIEGERYALVTQELASIPKRLLGKKVVSLEEERYEITSALDFLFVGF